MIRSILFNNATSVSAASASVVNPAGLAADRIGLFDADDMAAGTKSLSGALAAGVKRIIIAQGGGADGKPRLSPVINVADIVQTFKRVYAASAAQVSYVGYQGSGTATIVSGAHKAYTLRLTKNGERPESVQAFTYQAGAAPTPFVIADNLARQINAKAVRFAAAEVLADITTAQLVDTNGTPASVTLGVTKNSDRVVATVTSGTNLVAGFGTGSYLRIGHATDKTNAIYQVKSVEAGTATTKIITLTRPFVGATVTSGVAAGYQNTAAVAGDAAGLKLTFEPAGQGFHTSLDGDGFDDLVAVVSTTPTVGSGSGAQVVAMEQDWIGTLGIHQTHTFAQDIEAGANASLNYDLYEIQFKTGVTPNISRAASVASVVIAVEEGTSGVDLATVFGK